MRKSKNGTCGNISRPPFADRAARCRPWTQASPFLLYRNSGQSAALGTVVVGVRFC